MVKPPTSVVCYPGAMPSQIVDELSQLGARTELDIFSVPPTEVSVQSTYLQEINTSSAINDGMKRRL